MRSLSYIAAAALIAFASAAPAAAASPGAVKAAQDATRAARGVTFHLLSSGGTGSVTLARIGRTRTRIVLHVPPGSHDLSARIYRGSDCGDQRHLAESLALAPINSAGAGAPVSQTIVSIPIERLNSDYLVAVRNASTHRQVAEACAHLRR